MKIILVIAALSCWFCFSAEKIPLYADDGTGAQMLDTRAAQELAEAVSNELRFCVAEANADVIPADAAKILQAHVSSENLTVMSREAYKARFPDLRENVLGHYETRYGRIYVENTERDKLVHIVAHETLHMCSYTEMRDEDGERYLRKGLHEYFYETGANGKILGQSDQGRALNEGVTELYTRRELEEHEGARTVHALPSYPDAYSNARLLEELVGADVLNAAYFGDGLSALKTDFNRKTGGEDAWARYSAALDAITYGASDDAAVAAAKADLARLYKAAGLKIYD